MYQLPKMEKERVLMEQVKMEITAGHFSRSFGTDLLPGMYSLLVHPMPKPDSEMLWLIIDHSSRDCSPNSIITREDITGIHLDRIHSLGASILQIKTCDLDSDVVLFKSDISATYLQLPMHPLYQILQVVTINGPWYVDQDNNFRGWASQIIWQSFISLVVWILIFECGLKWVKCYIDNIFSVSMAQDLTWYPPYCWTMPTMQAKVLQLWDKINLPHANRKQISGRVIPILRFKVDPNVMSAYLSREKWDTLVDTVHILARGSVKSLWEWLRMAGQINWALYVYLWLRLALVELYVKTAGKSQMWGKIQMNKTVQWELMWFIEHIKWSYSNPWRGVMVT